MLFSRCSAGAFSIRAAALGSRRIWFCTTCSIPILVYTAAKKM